MLQALCIIVLDWYHFYLNNPSGSRPKKITQGVCYCKCLVMQADLYAKPYNICQKFKNINNL